MIAWRLQRPRARGPLVGEFCQGNKLTPFQLHLLLLRCVRIWKLCPSWKKKINLFSGGAGSPAARELAHAKGLRFPVLVQDGSQPQGRVAQLLSIAPHVEGEIWPRWFGSPGETGNLRSLPGYSPVAKEHQFATATGQNMQRNS